MTRRGWFIARLVVVGLAALDMIARFWLRHVYTTDRPQQAQGAFVKAYPINIDKGPTFISNTDYTLLTSLEIAGFVLVVVFLYLQLSSRRPRCEGEA